MLTGASGTQSLAFDSSNIKSRVMIPSTPSVSSSRRTSLSSATSDLTLIPKRKASEGTRMQELMNALDGAWGRHFVDVDPVNPSAPSAEDALVRVCEAALHQIAVSFHLLND